MNITDEAVKRCILHANMKLLKKIKFETQQALELSACPETEDIFRGKLVPGQKIKDARFGKFKNTSDEVLYLTIAVPKPEEKPSIDWSHVHPKYKFLKTYKNGQSLLSTNNPVSIEEHWGQSIPAESFTSFKPGNCDWQDSLVQRPEGEWNEQDHI